LLPGFSANPTGHSKADRALISAIHAKYPPTTVMAMLDTAWVAAVKGGGWRGPVEVARLIIEYTIGKPIARSISVSSKAGDMLQQLASLHLGAGDGDAIDVEVEVEVEPAE